MGCSLNETANLTEWSGFCAVGSEWLHQAGEIGWQKIHEILQRQVYVWWNYHMNSRNWIESSAKENEMTNMLNELNSSSEEAKSLPVAPGRWAFPYVQPLWDTIWSIVSNCGLSHTRNTLSYWNRPNGKPTRWLKVHYLEGKDETTEFI